MLLYIISNLLQQSQLRSKWKLKPAMFLRHIFLKEYALEDTAHGRPISHQETASGVPVAAMSHGTHQPRANSEGDLNVRANGGGSRFSLSTLCNGNHFLGKLSESKMENDSSNRKTPSTCLSTSYQETWKRSEISTYHLPSSLFWPIIRMVRPTVMEMGGCGLGPCHLGQPLGISC